MLLVIACKVVKLTNERACETMVDRQFDDRIGQKRTNESVFAPWHLQKKNRLSIQNKHYWINLE